MISDTSRLSFELFAYFLIRQLELIIFASQSWLEFERKLNDRIGGEKWKKVNQKSIPSHKGEKIFFVKKIEN